MILTFPISYTCTVHHQRKHSIVLNLSHTEHAILLAYHLCWVLWHNIPYLVFKLLSLSLSLSLSASLFLSHYYFWSLSAFYSICLGFSSQYFGFYREFPKSATHMQGYIIMMARFGICSAKGYFAFCKPVHSETWNQVSFKNNAFGFRNNVCLNKGHELTMMLINIYET